MYGLWSVYLKNKNNLVILSNITLFFINLICISFIAPTSPTDSFKFPRLYKGPTAQEYLITNGYQPSTISLAGSAMIYCLYTHPIINRKNK